MTDFQLPVQNPYYRSKKLPVALLHFTAGFLLLNGWYESRIGQYPSWLAVIFLLLAAFEIIYTFFAVRLQSRYPHLSSTVRLVVALAFAIYTCMLFHDGQHLFAIFMILITCAFIMIYFVEERWNKPFMLRVNEQGVWFPRIFRSQLFPWDRFNHVILRGNLLTLDFTNNRIAQLYLDRSFDEQEAEAFNRFCRERGVMGR